LRRCAVAPLRPTSGQWASKSQSDSPRRSQSRGPLQDGVVNAGGPRAGCAFSATSAARGARVPPTIPSAGFSTTLLKPNYRRHHPMKTFHIQDQRVGSRSTAAKQLIPDGKICRALPLLQTAVCLAIDPSACPHSKQFADGYICFHPLRAEIIARTKAETENRRGERRMTEPANSSLASSPLFPAVHQQASKEC